MKSRSYKKINQKLNLIKKNLEAKFKDFLICLAQQVN